MKKSVYLFVYLLAVMGAYLQAAGKVDVSVPEFSRMKLELDGLAGEEFWQRAARITDFRIFRKPGQPKVKTEIRFCRDSRNLYLWMNFDEPAGPNPGKKSGSAWSGDCVEIFFGNLEPVDWYRQIVIGLNGKTYDEFIQPGDYSYKTVLGEKSWSLEIVFPFEKLGPLNQDTLGFNILRQSHSDPRLITWQDVHWGHEVDHFGTLQFYREKGEVTHGPWIYGLTSRRAGINWETAGRKGSALFFRKKGEAKFRRVLPNVRGDIQSWQHLLHPVMLENLLPDTEYEYYVDDRIVRSFRTLSEKSGDFSFLVVADIHARPQFLRQMLHRPYSRQSEMAFLLGDLVTGMSGRGICYECYLDQLCGEWKKPFFCIRGNHEYRGGGTEAFFELFPVDGGKSYFSFSHKGVCFVMLDTDGDDNLSEDYFREQFAWLKKVTAGREFRDAEFRVLMSHVPLFRKKYANYGTQIQKMYSGLSPEVQKSIDLMLCGHLHAYCRLRPGEVKPYSNKLPAGIFAAAEKKSFPVLVVDYDGSLHVTKTDRQLLVKAYSAAGGELIDQIRVIRR